MPLDLVRRQDPEAVREILASIPEWFGIPEANESYVADAGQLLRAAGVRILEVHTSGPSYEDEFYALTREFYLAQGFVPVNEFHGIDWDGPTLILVKPL